MRKIGWGGKRTGNEDASQFDRGTGREKYYDKFGHEIEDGGKIEYTVEHIRAYGNRHDL
ncbi:hypothetical protein [Mediterraneibacter gnavus]|uniref:hypothetical protein n=1 Tax=Mediterraneibacter gnavus TaxID=33038 RepID=UPI00356938FB